MKRTVAILGAIIELALTGAAGGQTGDPPPGVITFRLPDGPLYRVPAEPGAEPEDLSLALDALAPGSDDWANPSPDGALLLVSTGRFAEECAGWACLALLPADLGQAEVIRVAGQPVHPGGFGAVASGGMLIVYPDSGGPHRQDLWAITRVEEGWESPRLLTDGSPYQFHSMPALSAAGDEVLFDCGDVPYGQEGTAICRANTGGSDLAVLWRPDDVPPGVEPGTALHHADWLPDDGIVFEADWGGSERLWRLGPPGPPALITDAFGNDNSPCALSDGRIVSLWLGREANQPGYHEIKLMAAGGDPYWMLVTGVDVLDGGTGCGG